MRELNAFLRGVLIVVAAAVSSACPQADQPLTNTAPADSADQVVFGLNMQLTMDGVLRSRVQADTAYFYQISQKAVMRHIRVTFFSPEGTETSTLTAEGGTYEWRTGNMEARGNVLAVTPDRRRLTTSLLTYNRETQAIVGPEAFVFDSPDRHLEGDGFTSDPDFRNVVTRKPRKGTIGTLELQP